MIIMADIIKHKMRLWPNSFQAIKKGSKTIEMRLCDEKRSLIKIGDTIEFANTSSNDIVQCIVTNIYKYSSFEELYKNHDKISIGYKALEEANPKDMLMYYSNDDIIKYGVLAIEIKKY